MTPRKHNQRNKLFLAVSCALMLNPAFADDAAEENRVLEEVIVTAQKRSEDRQKAPVTVSVMDSEQADLFTSGGDDIRFLRGRLPSLQVESSFGRTFPRFYIRGYGNTDFDLNASQPVSLVYDEVVLENPILKGYPVFDVEQIEMLRGPQGTLFGRNTPAGVLKFNSRKPTQESEVKVKASIASFDSYNLEGVLNGGLGENMAGRLSVMHKSRGDWVSNTFTGESDALGGFDETAFRAQLQFDSGSMSGLFNIHGRSVDGTARLFRANIIKPGTNDLVEGFERDEIAIDGQNKMDLDLFGAMARLEFDMGNMTLTSVTGFESGELYSRGDIDGGYGAVWLPPSGPGIIPFASESADAIPDLTQITQEIRLSSNGWDTMNWTAGLFWFQEELDIESYSFDSLFGGFQNGYAEQHQEANAFAVFASMDYDLSESTKLKAGLRYSSDEKEFTAERFESPLAFLGVGPIGPISVNPDDSEVSWDLSVAHAMNDDINLFARVAKGFRAPAIQGRILFGDVVTIADSETVISFEGGVKSTLADGRARLNFTAFSYTVDDPQLTAVGGTTNFNALINADQSHGQGFELEMEALLSDNLQVTGSVSYNDTEIDDPNLYIQPCGGGCTVTDPAGAVEGTVSIDGNPLPHAPEWVANATVRWSTAMANGELYVYGDWAYRSEVNFFLYESPEFKGEALGEFGLRVGYSWDSGDQEVAFFGRNITDEEVIVGGIDFNNLTGFVNEPRIIGLEYSASF